MIKPSGYTSRNRYKGFRLGRILKADTDLKSYPAYSELMNKYFDPAESTLILSLQPKELKEETSAGGKFQQICLAQKLNTAQDVNSSLRDLHSLLRGNGRLLGYCETKDAVRINLLQRYRGIYGKIIYLMFFFWHRIFPKLSKFTLSIYRRFPFNGHFFSKAEVLGRLIYCGYDIAECKEDGDLLFFVASANDRIMDQTEPSFWPVFRMKRVGKDNRPIYVYKLRTMHPYSEFLQGYLKEQHGLDANGKFRNDFRVTRWGRLLRRYWFDELPMILNVIKGDLKIIGVRPISPHYLMLYSEEVRNLRTKVKPGLIPPFYADMPDSFEKILQSEKLYIDKYIRQPFATDMDYAVKIFRNIVIRKARSR